MKKTFALLVIAALILTCSLAGCSSTSTSVGLSYDKAIMAKNVDGTWQPVDSNTFDRGDNIGVVLMNVSGFKKGDDGLNNFNIDVVVKDESGNVVLSQDNVLGDGGKLDLQDNTAQSPVGSLQTTSDTPAGKYTFTLTLHDDVGSGKIVVNENFTLN